MYLILIIKVYTYSYIYFLKQGNSYVLGKTNWLCAAVDVVVVAMFQDEM
jgi:hypothetical protein